MSWARSLSESSLDGLPTVNISPLASLGLSCDPLTCILTQVFEKKDVDQLSFKLTIIASIAWMASQYNNMFSLSLHHQLFSEAHHASNSGIN